MNVVARRKRWTHGDELNCVTDKITDDEHRVSIAGMSSIAPEKNRPSPISHLICVYDDGLLATTVPIKSSVTPPMFSIHLRSLFLNFIQGLGGCADPAFRPVPCGSPRGRQSLRRRYSASFEFAFATASYQRRRGRARASMVKIGCACLSCRAFFCAVNVLLRQNFNHWNVSDLQLLRSWKVDCSIEYLDVDMRVLCVLSHL